MAKVVLEIGIKADESLGGLDAVEGKLEEIKQESISLGTTSKKTFKQTSDSATMAAKSLDGVQKETKELLDVFKTAEGAGKNLGKNVEEGAAKAKTGMAKLKQEIKEYKAAALEAGENTPIGRKFLKEAAEAQDRLGDLNNTVRNLASDTKVVDGVIGIGRGIAAGFSLAQGAAALFGKENEDLQKSLLKVQGAMAILNGLQEIQNLLQKDSSARLFITNALEKASAFTKGLMATATGALTVQTAGATVATNALTVATRVLLGPIGLIIAAISAVAFFWDDITAAIDGGIGELEKNLEITKKTLAIEKEKLDAISKQENSLKLAGFTEEQILQIKIKQIGIIIEQTKKQLEQQKQILMAQVLADQKNKKILEGIIKFVSAPIVLLLKQIDLVGKALGQEFGLVEGFTSSVAGIFFDPKETKDEGLKEIKAINETLRDLEDQKAGFLLTVKANNESQKKEQIAAANKLKEDALKLEKERQDALIALLKTFAEKQEQALIDGLNPEELVEHRKQLALAELEQLKKNIEEKGKLLNAEFKLTADQLEQFEIIRLSIEKKAADESLKIKQDEIKKKQDEEDKRLTDIKAQFEKEEQLQLLLIENQRRPNGLTDAEFEKIKQEQILEVKRAGIDRQLELLKDQNDLESEIVKENLKKQASEIDKQLKDIQDKGPKFSLEKLFGLNKEETAKLKDGFKQLGAEVINLIESQIAAEQELLDKRAEQNDKLIENNDNRIAELQNQLALELQLNEQGFASNVSLVQEQLLAEQAAREAALAEQKRIQVEQDKLARRQAIVDSLQQVTNLITASANIYKSLSALGPIGVAIAAATIAAMFTGFALSKAKAREAASFRKGGFTGEGGTTEEAGTVHKQEFVFTAEKTKKHRKFLEALHTDDNLGIQEGIADLLDGTGIQLDDEEGRKSAERKRLSAEAHIQRTGKASRGETEQRLESIEEYLRLIHKTGKDKTDAITDGNGNLIIKKGATTRIVRKK